MSPTEPNPLTQLSLDELRQRTSKKWRAFPSDVLPLWVAEMDVALAPAVADALRTAIDRGDTGYPSGDGYARAVADFAADRWGWDGIAAERTAIVADVMIGYTEVLRLLTEPGDAVVVNPPVYPPFYAFTMSAGRRVVEAPLGPDGRLDLDAVDAAYTTARAGRGTVVHLLCSPHNPTGVVHTRAELTALAALARRHGVRVVADEIHGPLTLPGATFTPYLSVGGTEDAFALTSASKAWNLAGLKAAIVIAGPDAAGDLARLPEEVGHGPSHLGVLAHTAAFDGGRDWLDALLAGLDHNRALLADLVAAQLPGVGVRRPEGTYLSWLDCRRVVTDGADPARRFLEHARVAVTSGRPFGANGDGYVRLNFATTPTILTEAIERMGASLRSDRPS